MGCVPRGEKITKMTNIPGPNPVNRGLMTRQEVADLLKVSVRSVDRLRENGALPAVMVLTNVRFRVDDVEALLTAKPPTGSTTPGP